MEEVEDKKFKKEKKEKKEKKRKLEEEIAVVEVSAEVETHEDADGEDDAEKKARKKAKKEAKQLKKLEEAAAAETAAAVVEEEENAKKKKDKKEKKEKKSSANNATEEAPKKKNKPSESSISSEIVANKKKFAAFAAKENDSGNLYVPHENTTAMTESDVTSYRETVGVAVVPDEDAEQYKPIVEFEYLFPSLGDHCPEIKDYLKKKNFKNPSAIQASCWPPLLAGRDVVGIAQTGSGKTLAFLFPAMLKIASSGPQVLDTVHTPHGTPTPRILVIAPTRELAMQSHQVVVEVGGLKSVCIYGGVPKQSQKADLRAGAEVVVATPGRLIDLVDEGALSLAGIRYLVLDEADRMLDDGFEPAIRKILSQCPKAGTGAKDRQTAMFSATWPEEIRSLADTFLRHDVVRIVVGSAELSANHRVTQIVECIEAREKDRKLLALLDKYHKSRKNRVLVFVLYKKEAVTLQNMLQGRGYNVTAIHGDKSQNDRTEALEEFKSGRIPLLIATDVAARGLDIPQVEYVLNYSFPLTVEDYVHRIGRTGRGGATGTSHTFFTDFDKVLAGALVAVLQEAKQEVPKEIYKYPLITKKKSSKLYGDFGPKPELSGKKASKITFDD